MAYKQLQELIEVKKEKFYQVADEIWEFAELAYQEEASSKRQRDLLKEEGFAIEEEVGGIATAFSARYGSGKPVIGFLGEFDALPGLSQKADSTKEEALVVGGSGHGCGHHLLGTGCMQAAVGLKDLMEIEGLPGTLIYYGCPAEEGGAGKAFMVRENVFKDADICLAWHPFDVTVSSTSSLANARVFYNFKGVSSHAAVAPHLGRSALDTVELMNVGVNYLREHMIPEARIHYAVTNTGGHAPNVVQSRAQVLYSVRAPQNDQLIDLLERVHNIARGAALMCGTEVDIQVVGAYADMLQNRTLDALVYKHIQALYPQRFSEEELAYAENFFQVGDKSAITSYQNLATRFLGTEGRKFFQGPMALGFFPPNPQKVGSTDVGDVSWNVPTAWFSGQTFALGTAVHTWQAVAQGKSSLAHKGMSTAAQVMARTALDILKNPSYADKAWQDLEEALAGREYKTLIPEHVKPGMINQE